jgi:hypothetical protein
MTAYMTTTDDRETELLADALAQTYSDAVWAQVGDRLPLTDEVFKVAWYRVAERAKELGRRRNSSGRDSRDENSSGPGDKGAGQITSYHR